MALVAQGMALMSPVCFVRCVSADGHQCIELTGQGCHCCDCRSHKGSPEVCAVAKFGHHHEDEQEQDHEHDAPVGWQARCEHCNCQHAPLDAGQQVQSKSLSTFGLSVLPAFVSTLNFAATIHAWDVANVRPTLLRPQESPQLAALATVVLRV
jgi:hypothetical protein